jgi:chromosome condensin MukBEF ATPase and DNA-binding subunit MukB
MRRFANLYNRRRPHISIGGDVPQAAMNHVLGHHNYLKVRASGSTIRRHQAVWQDECHR